MTLKEFLSDPSRTLTAVEFLDDTTILNVVINNGELYALDVDTSHITDSRMVVRKNITGINDDILTIDTFTVDMNTVQMVSHNREF
jgi:hypothetical protein